jgi:hypothetical protein
VSKAMLSRLTAFIGIFFVLVLNIHCAQDEESVQNASPLVTVSDDDFVVPPPYSGRSSQTMSKSLVGRATQVVFLNFDGGAIRPAYTYGDDSQENTSFIPRYTATIPAFDHSPYVGDRSAVIEQLTGYLVEEFQGYNIEFVSSRPAKGDYTMMMIGGRPSNIGYADGGMIGLSPLDYGNDNPNDVGFVFSASMERSSLRSLSFVIAHELGHTFGLDHINASQAIMYPSLMSGNLIWTVGPKFGNPFARQDDKAILAANLGSGTSKANLPPSDVSPAPTPTPTPPPSTTPTTTTDSDANALLVNKWYLKYLGAKPDSATLKTYAAMLAEGQSRNQVLSQILGSDFYYRYAGGKYVLFVPRIFKDITGFQAPPFWVDWALGQLKKTSGSIGRTQIAMGLLTVFGGN